MQKKLKELQRRPKSEPSYLKRRMVKPAVPQNPDGKVLVHIGCGQKNALGFTNIDARPSARVPAITDDLAAVWISRFELPS